MTLRIGAAGLGRSTRARLTAAVAALVAAMALVVPAPASAAPVWAPVGEATIFPGVQTITAGMAQCTSNFVFFDKTDIYLGQAAHCSMQGDPLTASDPLSPTGPAGCSTQSLPLGTPIQIQGATKPGTLAYNSWITMQEIDETRPHVCSYNDFALVRIDPADHGRVNPTMPHWGGPTGVALATSPGEKVVSYGNSELRLGIPELRPKEGISRGQTDGGWNHTVFTVTPGIPGDSGSGFLDSEGKAFGVLSTLVFLPRPAHNGVGDVARELAYVGAHTDLDGVQLALGTEPFKPASSLDAALPLLPPVLDVIDIPLAILNDLLNQLP
ncbi:MAG TPA: serine protease [Actinomycetota bacterium]|nr:serine protease [Actinomycetota bacterium]